MMKDAEIAAASLPQVVLGRGRRNHFDGIKRLTSEGMCLVFLRSGELKSERTTSGLNN